MFEITINGKTEKFETAQEMAEYVERMRPIQPTRNSKNRPTKKTETTLNKIVKKRVSTNERHRI